jgi:hypothetical protein
MEHNQEIRAMALEIAALMLGETMEGREREKVEEVIKGYIPLADRIFQYISSGH